MQYNRASLIPALATLVLKPHIARLHDAGSAAYVGELCPNTSSPVAVPQQVHASPAAAAHLGDLPADEDLRCQANNRHAALLLLGLLY